MENALRLVDNYEDMVQSPKLEERVWKLEGHSERADYEREDIKESIAMHIQTTSTKLERVDREFDRVSRVELELAVNREIFKDYPNIKKIIDDYKVERRMWGIAMSTLLAIFVG
jgi:ferritin-like metal-binding protein YciE